MTQLFCYSTRVFLAVVFVISSMAPLSAASRLSTEVDPVKQAAWEKAKADAARRVAEFDAAVKAGKPERIRRAALELQSDPVAVQELNRSKRPDLVEAHNQVAEKIKAGARGNIKENMVKEWNKAHPNDPPITTKDVEIFQPTNPRGPLDQPKVGQDWDVTVRVKGKDVPPGMSQKVVEKSYYDAAGGEKTFGKRATGQTPEQAAHAAAERQSVETTHAKSPEAYNEPEKIIGKDGKKPKIGERLSDPEQLTQAIEYKSNLARNKSEQAASRGNTTEAARQEFEQMRQASKQYDKIVKPRVEAAGGAISPHVDEGMKILDEVKNLNMSPEQARAELAKMGETPESIIKKASVQVADAEKLAPKVRGSAPEPAGGGVKGEPMKPVGAKPVEPTAKPSITSRVLAGAGLILGIYGIYEGYFEAKKEVEDKKREEPEGFIEMFNRKAELLGATIWHGLGFRSMEKTMAQAEVDASRQYEKDIADGKVSKKSLRDYLLMKASGVIAGVYRNAKAILIDATRQAGSDTADAAIEIAGAATDKIKALKDGYVEGKTNEERSKTVHDMLIKKGASPVGAQRAADGVLKGDYSEAKRLNKILEGKLAVKRAEEKKKKASERKRLSKREREKKAVRKEAQKQEQAARGKSTEKQVNLRETVIAKLRARGLPTAVSLVDRLTGILESDGEKALDAAIGEMTGMQGTFTGFFGGTFKLRITVKGTQVTGTCKSTVTASEPLGIDNRVIVVTTNHDAALRGDVELTSGTISFKMNGTMTTTISGTGGPGDRTTTAPFNHTFSGSFTGKGYKGGSTGGSWSVSR